MIREIQLLGNLANKKNYEYTEDEFAALFDPIEEELRIVRSTFASRDAEGGRIQFK